LLKSYGVPLYVCLSLFIEFRERVYTAKIGEVFPDKCISAIGFSAVGKCLSVGFSDGTTSILDFESSDVLVCRSCPNTATIYVESPIVSFAWQRIKDGERISEVPNSLHKLASYFGGVNQIHRAGMAEYCDPNAAPATGGLDSVISLAATSPYANRRELLSLLSDFLHLSMTASGGVTCHVLGVFPLFQVAVAVPATVQCGLVSGSYMGAAALLLLHRHRHHPDIDAAARAGEGEGEVSTVTSVGFMQAVGGLQGHRWREQCGSLHLSLECNLSRLQDIITGCGRKWKEAGKVVLPKMMLMQTLLDTYELKMSPVEFCFTISMCGMWHPAAAVAFSQHWNDQGLLRLRASFEAASRSIVKLLQTAALPLATNCLLAARLVYACICVFVYLCVCA
jgi:hypothetical protein